MQENPEDPEAAPVGEDANDLKLEGARPPPVNSNYLPLPWKGRLGYVGWASLLGRTTALFPVGRLSNLETLGLSQHLSPTVQPSRLQFEDMSHIIHTGAPPPPERRLPARACDQEPARQGTACRLGLGTQVRSRPRPGQRARYRQNDPVERQVWHQVYALEFRDVPLCQPRGIWL